VKLLLTGRPIDPGEDPGSLESADAYATHREFYNFCPLDSWRPAVNLYESADSYYVCVDLAGMDPETIEVEVKKSILVIAGTRSHPQPPWELGERSIHLMEIDQGPFCRSVEIPTEVDVEGIQASYSGNGMLWIELPKND
jgi:HSP20 family protein